MSPVDEDIPHIIFNENLKKLNYLFDENLKPDRLFVGQVSSFHLFVWCSESD
jgi:hypothetical protein